MDSLEVYQNHSLVEQGQKVNQEIIAKLTSLVKQTATLVANNRMPDAYNNLMKILDVLEEREP